jgi:hypothetical protein
MVFRGARGIWAGGIHIPVSGKKDLNKAVQRRRRRKTAEELRMENGKYKVKVNI